GFHRGGFSGSDQLLAWETLHNSVLSASQEACKRKRPGGGAEHVADVLQAVVLVHRGDFETGRFSYVALSRLRAVVRRMGIHVGGQSLGTACVVTGRTQVSDGCG